MGSALGAQLMVSQLLYADDMVISRYLGAQVNKFNFLGMCWVLQFNSAKPMFISIGEVPLVDLLTALLGCRVGSLLVSHLGN